MKAPSFPFYVRDWLCSRKVATMTGDEVKAYIYLLCESWLNIPRATLPDNDIELSEMARLPMDKWLQVKTKVMRCFENGECEEHEGLLFNELLLHISRKSENKQRLNNKNAKRSRIVRKLNTKEIEKKKKKSFIKPSFDEFVEYCQEKGFGKIGRKAFEYYDAADWKDSQGKQIRSWKQKLIGVWFKDENRGPAFYSKMAAEENSRSERLAKIKKVVSKSRLSMDEAFKKYNEDTGSRYTIHTIPDYAVNTFIQFIQEHYPDES